MKKTIVKLLASLGLGATPVVAAPTTLDPNTILFSMSTIADDAAPIEPSGESPTGGLNFHEDEWRQVEFFERARLPEVQKTLVELKAFAARNQAGVGWRNVYVRKIAPAPVIAGENAVSSLEHALGVKRQSAPTVWTGGNGVLGRVTNGFSLPLGRGVALYGFMNGEGVQVLGAHVGGGGDDQSLVRAFTVLSTTERLILVDWRAQLLLVGTSADGQIEAWRP